MTSVCGPIELLAGFILVGLVLYDVFQSVVVPRWSDIRLRLSPLLIKWCWPIWRKMAFSVISDDKRENFLGTFAPLALMITLVMWVLSLILGFAMAIYALSAEIKPVPSGFGDALYLAGTSLFTLGFGDMVATGGLARVVLLLAAASGLAVVALVISLTFSLYGSFQRREVLILTLDARAGVPPSGLALLETYAQYHMLDDLPLTFSAWEVWAAEMLESHIAYPILPYFRSSHTDESWISALGAVLDAATLLMTTVQAGPECQERLHGAARMVYRLGCHAVTDLSHWFRFHAEGQGGCGVERAEFENARQALRRAGYGLRDAEEAWTDFVKYRSVYASSLNAMARHFATPPSQWIGDRSTLAFLHLSNPSA